MDDRIKLKDYEFWKKSNRNLFSKRDYIHAIITSKKASLDLYFAFLDLYWPKFVEKDNMIFIEDSLQTKKQLLEDQKTSPKEKEYWINFLSIDGLLTNEEDQDKLSHLSMKIAEAWKSKLHNDFPKRKFKLHVISDDDDIAVTFHQVFIENK